MEDLKIEATDHSPSVHFSMSEQKMMIEGQSLPENAKEFYDPIVDWAESLFDNTPDSITLKLNLSYLNSSSSKQILRLLFVLEDLKEEGTDVSVIWKYQANDELMRDKGEEFGQMLEIAVKVESL